jgi:ABC-type Fe3+-hydroxamate transport system substrate-binding protein
LGIELFWIVPFLCIALIGIGASRSLPRIPDPAHYRTILDSEGVPVKIEEPFRGAAIGNDYYYTSTWWMENVRSADELMHAGNPGRRGNLEGSLMGWIYPEVVAKDSLWEIIPGSNHGPFIEIESLMAFNPSVYVDGPVDLLRSVGMPVVPYWPGSGWNPPVSARVMSNIAGHPERGEAYVARDLIDKAKINQLIYEELQSPLPTYRPRVLDLDGSHGIDVPEGAAWNAAKEKKWDGYDTGDAEIILAIDPDIVLNRWPQDFMQDPRWQGLKAVKERRVYSCGVGYGFNAMLLDQAHLYLKAEIFQPERMTPRVRQLVRERVLEEFDYRLSDDQIDEMLNAKGNSSSRGFERFLRDYPDRKGLEK